jgi:hypothetical protein
MSQPDQKPRLKRPVEQVRAELLSDPETKRIAKAVGMELEAYVNLVLDYAQNPDKEPILEVAPDEELRAAGYNPPSAEDVANFFIAGAKGEIDLGEKGPDFSKSEFESSAAAGGKPSIAVTPGQAPSAPSDPAKRDDLMDQLKKGSRGGSV